MAPDTAGVSISQCSQSLPQVLLLIPHPTSLLVLYWGRHPKIGTSKSGATTPSSLIQEGGRGMGCPMGCGLGATGSNLGLLALEGVQLF